MKYDIEQVKNDIVEMKDIVNTQGFERLKFLGAGYFGSAYAHKSAVVKRQTHCSRASKSIIKPIEYYIKQSQKAAERGINIVPHLDYQMTGFDPLLTTCESFVYMPFQKGDTTKSKNGLARLVEMDNDGIKKFFDDFHAIYGIGLNTDDNSYADNYIVDGNSINFIDLNPSRESFSCSKDEREQVLNYRAMSVLLCHWYGQIAGNPSVGKDKKKMIIELIGNTRDVISKMPNTSFSQRQIKWMVEHGL
jgi:hypothetical protein